jgi:glycosyltransferase involved in cell wall biosynthesis
LIVFSRSGYHIRAMRKSILWLPSHPAEGYSSMDRYWRELEKCFSQHPELPFRIDCPLGKAPADSRAAGRFQRVLQKYVSYPFKVKRAARTDVVHLLDHSSAHLLRQVPRGVYKIVTVHDLAPLEDPSGLTRAQLRRFRAAVSLLSRADLLLSDSAYTARALQPILQREQKVAVLPLGVDVASYSRPTSLMTLRPLPSCPKILSIGSTIGRKNLRILPRVLAQVSKEVGPVALVRVGGRLDPELLTELSRVLPAEHIVELGSLAEEQLVALYQHVDLLIFPSTLEGFGLPSLEAMAAGCPVVSSDASSLPEVGGDAALYFDPHAPEQAAAQIIRLLGEPPLRDALIERGRQRAATLSWDRHVEKLAEYYQHP